MLMSTEPAPSEGTADHPPSDIKIGPDSPRIVWQKRKWLCTNTSCRQESFKESNTVGPAAGPDDATEIF